jgi:DNA repair protein RadD
MSFTLRPYQQRAVDNCLAYLKDPKKKEHGIAVLPTGSGKSLVIAGIVNGLEGNVLILQPSKEILEQNYAKYVSYGNMAGIYSASVGVKDVQRVTFAMIGSIKGQGFTKMFKYIIIDECHYVNAEKGMYVELINSLKDVRVIGLTATPYRLSTSSFGSTLKFLTRTRPRVFSNVVSVVQTRELFDAGYLSKLQYYKIDCFDPSQVALNSTGAEYDDRALKRYLKDIRFDTTVTGIVRRLLLKDRRGILVFTRFIEESLYVKQEIGADCEVVTGDTPKKERERILSDFKEGKIKVICNVGVLTTGFDYPELDTVVLARPTRSLSLYYQMVGRAVRPHKDKECAWIVDMVGLSREFGRVEDLHLELSGGKYWQIKTNGKPLTNVILNPNLNNAVLSTSGFRYEY